MPTGDSRTDGQSVQVPVTTMCAPEGQQQGKREHGKRAQENPYVVRYRCHLAYATVADNPLCRTQHGVELAGAGLETAIPELATVVAVVRKIKQRAKM